MSKWAVLSLFFAALLCSVIVARQAWAAFSEPTAAPPEDNAPTFLNIGEDTQAKIGKLRLGTNNIGAPFNYQLEVLGEGAVITKVVSDNLKVSEGTNTLYVDSANNRVCVGPCLNLMGSKLEVRDGGMNINAQANDGLTAVSSSNTAIYGSGANFGVEGMSSGVDNNGVSATNVTGTAVTGLSNSSNAFDRVWCYYQGASTEYNDCTAGARSISAGDANNANGYLFRYANTNIVFFGSSSRFNGLAIVLASAVNSGTVRWEYWNGTAWVSINSGYPFSGAYNFLSSDQNPAMLTLWADWSSIPSNWTPTRIQPALETTDLYYIRARATVNFVSPWSVGSQFTIIRPSNVLGASTSGYGIFGTDDNADGLGLWAGYFDGPVGTNDDLSGAKYLAMKPKISLIPFTSGQTLTEYNFTNAKIKAFDGSYLWGIDGDSLYKIRASDGFQIFKVNVGSTPTDVLYDGNYIWVTVDGGGTGQMVKIDPSSGVEVCNNSTNLIGPRSVVFDGQYYWVLDKTDSDAGRLIKINNLCALVNAATLADGSSNQIDFSDGKVIYNGAFLWAIGADANSGNGVVTNINPSSLKVVAYTGLVGQNPQDIFYDNYYYWVTNRDDNTVTRYYLGANMCTAGNTSPTDSPLQPKCTVDADCDSSPGAGDGTCFAQPISYGTYAIANGSEPTSLAFDGTYLWLTAKNSTTNKYDMFKLLAADPMQQTAFTGLQQDNPLLSLLFDGTNLWAGTTGTNIKKIYSGTGWGLTDLSRTLALQPNAPLTQQNGSIGISGSMKIGGSYTTSGDLTTSGNLWQEAITADTIGDGINPVGNGTNNFPVNCPAGHFVKNIKTIAGVVVQVECRGL